MQFERKSRISNWTGPDLDRQTERRAALKSLELLKELEAAYEKAITTGEPLHWIFDTGVLGADVCRFSTTRWALAKCASRSTTGRPRQPKPTFRACGF